MGPMPCWMSTVSLQCSGPGFPEKKCSEGSQASYGWWSWMILVNQNAIVHMLHMQAQVAYLVRFCFSNCLWWQTNDTQLWFLHKFSVHPVKLWLGSIWGQDWSATSWSAALLGTNAVSERPILPDGCRRANWRSPPAAPACSEPIATALARSFFTPVLPYAPDPQQQNIFRQLVLVAAPLRMQTSLWKSTIKFTQIFKMFSEYFQGNKPSNHPLRHHT